MLRHREPELVDRGFEFLDFRSIDPKVVRSWRAEKEKRPVLVRGAQEFGRLIQQAFEGWAVTMFTGVGDETDGLQPIEEALIANRDIEISQDVDESVETCSLNPLNKFSTCSLPVQLSDKELLQRTFPQVIEAGDRERLKLTLDEHEVLITFMAPFYRLLSSRHHIDVTVPTWPAPKSLVLHFGKDMGF